MKTFKPDFTAILREDNDPDEVTRKMMVEYLRQYAAFKGVSQIELAELTGFHQSNIARIFSGKYSPTLDVFLKLSKALKLKLFFSRNGSRYLRIPKD